MYIFVYLFVYLLTYLFTYKDKAPFPTSSCSFARFVFSFGLQDRASARGQTIRQGHR